MVFAVAITSERRLANGGPLLLLLKRRGDAVQPPTLEGGIKEAAAMAVEPEVAEIPPMPLPQIMLPRNMTADALKPPLGAAQVAPPPRRLVDVDVCRGYYDVMGQFDITFNCTKGTYIYCCGTCHYRFCCEHQRNRLDQDSCTNYKSPIWANTQVPATQPPSRSDPDFDPLQQQSNNTAYVIGGVISFTLAVAIGVRVAFHKISRRPRNRDINMPRALVDILRHQSSPVQQGERNNSTVLTSTTGERTLAQQSKNLYMMNNAQLVSTGTLLSSKNINASPHPTLSHSFHNLAQLPPSYEAVMKPEINRYCSLKRLGEFQLQEKSFKNRFCPKPHKKYMLHSIKTGFGVRQVSEDFYLLEPPRRVMSQDHLLALGEGNTLSYLSKNQQHQYYKAIATSMNTNSQTHRKSHERLLVSPDRLEERMIGGGMGDYGLGIMSTMSHLNHHKKAQSQQNVCVTPSLDRHHMIKMNSNPSSGREQERSVVAMSAGHGASAPSWGEGHSSGGGAGTMGHSARRMAFATKRQNTIEQLHFLPGGGGGGGGVGSQALRTGSKNEVTV
uniref:Shisa N-terminal domain-containing protein n=1 Tax=Electrophorus electricus TaxID=8005 RepID=A0AAY5EPJ1_ELEEL